MPLTIGGVALLAWGPLGVAAAGRPAARGGAGADRPGAGVRRAGRGADPRGRRRGDRRGRRGALRADQRGRAQRRAGVPVRLRGDLPRHGRAGVAVGRRLGGLGARRQGRRRGAGRRGRRAGRWRGSRSGRRRGRCGWRRSGSRCSPSRRCSLAYGAAELVGGYGFLAVFACALTVRSVERDHDYHRHMHDVIARLETLLTLVVLLGLGFALTNGLLDPPRLARCAGRRWRWCSSSGRWRGGSRSWGTAPRSGPRRARPPGAAGGRVLRGARGRLDLLRRLRRRGRDVPRGALAVVDGGLHRGAVGGAARHPRDAGDAPARRRRDDAGRNAGARRGDPAPH